MRADDLNLGVGLGQEVHRAHLAANLLIARLQIAQRNVTAQVRAVNLGGQPAAIGRQFHRRADFHEMAARGDAGLGVHGFDADQTIAARLVHPLALAQHHADAVFLLRHHLAQAHVQRGGLAVQLAARHMALFNPHDAQGFGTVDNSIKLGPGFDRDLIPDTCEAQWISVNGDVVEVGLWFGPLKRESITRAALVMNADGLHELTAAADSADAEVGELGQYLYEPDGAVIRARLIGDFARSIGAHMLDEHIAYMSSDVAVSTPFASTFEVVHEFALDVKVLAKELKSRGIGTLEIKKRGVDIDPAEFRKRLSLSGKNSARLFLSRLGERRDHAAGDAHLQFRRNFDEAHLTIGAHEEFAVGEPLSKPVAPRLCGIPE